MKNKMLYNIFTHGKNNFRSILFAFTVVFFSFHLNAQTLVTVSGKAYDKENKSLPLTKLMVINKRTNNGIFADAEGHFSISILQSDTLIFSAIGFKVKKISLKDSIIKNQYTVEIPLQKLSYDLKEVNVYAERSLNEIQKDIDKLGVKKSYSVTGVNVLESPITALYERFSKFGKQKQKVAEWENEDLRRDILKDLFRLYVKYDIIDLSDDQFDDFIDYLHLSDDFIQKASQFELVMAIKGRYESYKYRWK
ncbi:MAG: carboxypeptidase-like regulatory domain-containing protein [Bacteroidia bacterium]